jgi:hypothetical protein
MFLMMYTPPNMDYGKQTSEPVGMVDKCLVILERPNWSVRTIDGVFEAGMVFASKILWRKLAAYS